MFGQVDGTNSSGETAPVSLLIVDDSPYVLRSLKMTLRSVQGVDVMTANDGTQAVEHVAQAAPDLVLMDVQMPRMNGFEATRKVKLESPDTRVVMMSVQAHESVREASHASGADHYITKAELQRTLLPWMKALFPRLEIWA